MSLEFEEPRYAVPAKKKTSSLTAFVIQSGFAKDEKGANIMLVLLLVLLIGGIAGLWLSQPKDVIEPAPEPALLP